MEVLLTGNVKLIVVLIAAIFCLCIAYRFFLTEKTKSFWLATSLLICSGIIFSKLLQIIRLMHPFQLFSSTEDFVTKQDQSLWLNSVPDVILHFQIADITKSFLLALICLGFAIPKIFKSNNSDRSKFFDLCGLIILLSLFLFSDLFYKIILVGIEMPFMILASIAQGNFSLFIPFLAPVVLTVFLFVILKILFESSRTKKIVTTIFKYIPFLLTFITIVFYCYMSAFLLKDIQKYDQLEKNLIQQVKDSRKVVLLKIETFENIQVGYPDDSGVYFEYKITQNIPKKFSEHNGKLYLVLNIGQNGIAKLDYIDTKIPKNKPYISASYIKNSQEKEITITKSYIDGEIQGTRYIYKKEMTDFGNVDLTNLDKGFDNKDPKISPDKKPFPSYAKVSVYKNGDIKLVKFYP